MVPQAASGFGPKLTAAVAYLSGVGRLSKRTIRTLLADLCDLPVSIGAVSPLEATVGRALAPIHAGGYRHVPVVDEGNRPVGVLSAKRVIRYLAEHFPATVYNQPPDPHRVPDTPDGA
jgi:CBS domain-containing protein